MDAGMTWEEQRQGTHRRCEAESGGRLIRADDEQALRRKTERGARNRANVVIGGDVDAERSNGGRERQRAEGLRGLRLGELGIRGEEQTRAGDSHREAATAEEGRREKGRNAADDRAALGKTHRGADDELLTIGVDEGDLDEAVLHHAPEAEGVADAVSLRVDRDGVNA